MDTKDLIVMPLILILTAGGIIATSLSQRLRDVAFFLLVTCAIIYERFDVNFFSHYWYRGTTRGFEVAITDILALSILISSWLVPRYGPKRWYWPAGLGLMLVYALYAAFSVSISEPKIFGAFELSKTFRAIIVFVAAAHYLRTRKELMILVAALCCVTMVEALYAVRQRYWFGEYRVGGTLAHPNSLSMYLCLIGPMLVAGANIATSALLRWACYVAIVVAALTELLTLSRAGLPIFIMVTGSAALFCMSWRLTFGKFVISTVLMIGGASVIYAAWDSITERYEQSTLEQEYLDTTGGEGRGVYLRWGKMMAEEHPYGVGLNNWSYWVSKEYGRRLGFYYEDYAALAEAPERYMLPSYHYAAPAHNLAALTAGELGWPGLVVFGLCWLRWFQIGAVCLLRRFFSDPMYIWSAGLFFGLFGVFLQSLTEWTFRQTPILFTFHIMLGGLVSLYHLRQRTRQAEFESEAAADEFQKLNPQRTPALAGRW